MLILIGTVPTAYALNHAVTGNDIQDFIAASEQAGHILDQHVDKTGILGADARTEVTDYIRTKQLQPDTILALRELVEDLNHEVALYKEFKAVPANQQTNVRNDMYVASEAIRLMQKSQESGLHCRRERRPHQLQEQGRQGHQVHSRPGLRSPSPWRWAWAPWWAGSASWSPWRKDRQGAPDLRAGRAPNWSPWPPSSPPTTSGLPVSTTHVLSSGVAGTMAANRSGLQMSTIRNIAAAWVFTLPAAALLSGSLFWLFRHVG